MSNNNLLKNLNPEQKKAVTHKNGPVLVVAGAGTGKTMVITRRIAWLIKEKIAKPDEILALTFTDKAAAEMEERVDQLVPYGYTDTWIGTFHSFGDELIRDNHLELGLSADFRVLTEPEQILFIKENLFKFKLDKLLPLGNPEKFIPALLKVISRAKDEGILPGDYKKCSDALRCVDAEPTMAEKIDNLRQKEIAHFYETYQKLMQENNYLDFGDQILLSLQLFKKRSDILKQYQEKYKYILVDEYQDTNYAQNELVKLLAKAHQNIMVVGDDDQSIYKFRGAAVSNILQFEKSFPKLKKIVLIQNYRSGQEILDKAYQLIQFNNPDRLEIKNKINKKLISAGGQKGIVEHKHFEKDYEEADSVAQKIEAMKKNDLKLNYQDFAILVRANSGAESFALSLKQLGIPYVFSGEKGYYQLPEISFMISFLKVIANPDDNLALYNLITSEFYDFPQLDLVICNQYARRKNLSLREVFGLPAFTGMTTEGDDLKIGDDSKEIAGQIIKEIKKYTTQTETNTVGQVLYSFLEDKKYLKKLAKNLSEENEKVIKNISHFFNNKIKSFELTAENKKSAHEFVDYLESLIVVGESEKNAQLDPDLDAVNILTVHSAKGLEFENVFMVNLVKGSFPGRNRRDQLTLPDNLIKEILPEGDAHIQEERRLFYVGMTRTKANLFLSSAESFENRKRPKKLSRFVLEALDQNQKIDFEKATISQLERIRKFNQRNKTKQCKLPKSLRKKVITLSAGQIDDYLTCPKKYYFTHVVKIPLLQNHAIVFGKAVHNTIENILKDKQKGHLMSFAEVEKAFENHWENEGYLTREHEDRRKKEGKLALRNVLNYEKQTKQIPLQVEEKFKFSIADILVRGRFDRVDKTKEGITLSDYKTSSDVLDEKKAKERVRNSKQLKIYALAYQNMYNETPAKISLIFPVADIRGEREVTEKDLKKAESEIKQVAKGVKGEDFEAKPDFNACKYCSFKDICPDREGN